jgi:lysophospholipase L1-like esterase
VYGTEDTENHGRGGYVLRAEQLLQGATVNSFGYPGITTTALTLKVSRAFKRKRGHRLATGLEVSDLIILDVGRNDEWSKTYAETAADLQALRVEIEDGVKKRTGFKPLVVTAVLMVTRTIKKAAWIAKLNRYIESHNTKAAPTDLRFHSVPYQYCGSDRIHPTSQGYEKLAKVLVKYVTVAYPKHVEALRKDKDQDGLYDIFEGVRFGTDPHNSDTDGDGVRDGGDLYPLQ